MTVYKVPVTVKKIKTFLKNALVFDMEFYFGHIIIHTYVRTSLYVCITIWEYTCTNMFSDAGKTYFGIPYIFASGLRNIKLPDGVTYKIVDKELEE